MGRRGEPEVALTAPAATCRLVIFDCDGVLVDSEPIANRLFAEALAEIGWSLSYEEVCRRFTGLTMSHCLEQVEARLGHPVPAGFLDRLQARTFEAFRAGLQPVPGVAAAIRRIALPDCVASSGEIEKMRLTLGITGLLPHFEGRLFSADQVRRGKPHPDLFLHAAARMGAEPGECVVVEDSLPGVQAAVAAGMRVLGFAHDGPGTPLSEAGATTFTDMADLPGLIGP